MGGIRGSPLTRWILYGKIRILQRTGKASPDRPLRFSEVKRAKRKGKELEL